MHWTVVLIAIGLTASPAAAFKPRTVPPSSEPVAVATWLGAAQSWLGHGVRVEIAEVVRFEGIDHANVQGFADSATVNYGWVCKVRNGLLMGDLLIMPRKFRPSEALTGKLF